MKYLIISLTSLFLLSFSFLRSDRNDTQNIISQKIKTLIADDFPIPNSFLDADSNDIYSIHELEYKGLTSLEKKWFTNTEKSETIIMELYTDKHRLRTHYFGNEDIPLDLINEMRFDINNGNQPAANSFKQKYFKYFIDLSDVIKPKYFKRRV